MRNLKKSLISTVYYMATTNRLFAIGDIHGCFDSFQELIENKIQLAKNDKLVLLGDYIDRGTKSKEVVEYIICLQEKGYDIIALAGNHEVMFLNAFVDSKNISLWMQNGGPETLISFGIDSISKIDAKYLHFLKGLPFFYSFENYLFVHAGFNDSIINPFEDTYSMVWNSQKRYSNPLLSEKTIIHGHRPITLNFCSRQIENNPKVINIDTGCVYKESADYGKLTAIELYSQKLFSI